MSKVKIINANKDLFDRTKSREFNFVKVAAYCRVSTDSEEQLLSYKSQVHHYKDLVNSNPEWELVDIYADEGISGTQVFKRTEFQRLINDAIDGKIDMIITKSISRFARNTLDTLKYVRLLKEKNVAIQFEKENINTLTMNGEMLLVILSSLAQQESESISANVKMGLKMKMKRGELVGFHGCLGYDYDSNTKTLEINDEESKIVKYIFSRYVEGAGSFIIAKELKMLGHKTKKGNINWTEGSVRRILKNEKYKGDIMMGKTFTVDPITHRRLENMGEEDKYYIDNHHTAIVSNEMFDKAQEILAMRSKKHNGKGRNEKYSRKYAFSSKLKCGFCDTTAIRRTWHAKSAHEKHVWSCMSAIKHGKASCPNSKGISEKDIEDIFIKSFNLLCSSNKNIINDFLKDMEDALMNLDVHKEIKDVDQAITKYESKINKLVDMHIEEIIDKQTYEDKYNELYNKLCELKSSKYDLENSMNDNMNVKNRIKIFKDLYEKNEAMLEFDRNIFDSVIEEVIIGNIYPDGKIDPYFITLIFKTGLRIEGNTKEKKSQSLHDQLCSYTEHESRGVRSKNTKDDIVKILVFNYSTSIFSFNTHNSYFRSKNQLNEIKVCIALRI